jgi:hypothetical protein
VASATSCGRKSPLLSLESCLLQQFPHRSLPPSVAGVPPPLFGWCRGWFDGISGRLDLTFGGSGHWDAISSPLTLGHNLRRPTLPSLSARLAPTGSAPRLLVIQLLWFWRLLFGGCSNARHRRTHQGAFAFATASEPTTTFGIWWLISPRPSGLLRVRCCWTHRCASAFSFVCVLVDG